MSSARRNCVVTLSITTHGDHTSHQPTPHILRQTISRIDSKQNRRSRFAKVRSLSVTSAPRDPCHHWPLLLLRLISCNPTPRPRIQTAIPFDENYSRPSIGQIFRASNAVCMSGRVDKFRRHTIPFRSASMTDEAPLCAAASQPHVAIAQTTRITGLLICSPPTSPIKRHFHIPTLPRQEKHGDGPV